MDNMTITSAQYVQADGVTVAIKAVIDGTSWSVPLDPANRHYAEIQRQAEAGELTIKDAD
tara:strand:- start:212 stop:391 length:180 start_codon:yes stop_codon:yes gene_type:complete